MPFSVSCGNGRRRQRACAMPLLCCAMILLCFAMILLCLLCSCDVLLRCCYKLLCFCYVLQSRQLGLPLPISILQFQIHHAVRGARVLAFVEIANAPSPLPLRQAQGRLSPTLGRGSAHEIVTVISMRSRGLSRPSRLAATTRSAISMPLTTSPNAVY